MAATQIKVDLDDPLLPTILQAVQQMRNAIDAVRNLPIEQREPIFRYLHQSLKADADQAAAALAEVKP